MQFRDGTPCMNPRPRVQSVCGRAGKDRKLCTPAHTLATYREKKEEEEGGGREKGGMERQRRAKEVDGRREEGLNGKGRQRERERMRYVSFSREE